MLAIVMFGVILFHRQQLKDNLLLGADNFAFLVLQLSAAFDLISPNYFIMLIGNKFLWNIFTITEA